MILIFTNEKPFQYILLYGLDFCFSILQVQSGYCFYSSILCEPFSDTWEITHFINLESAFHEQNYVPGRFRFMGDLGICLEYCFWSQ